MPKKKRAAVGTKRKGARRVPLAAVDGNAPASLAVEPEDEPEDDSDSGSASVSGAAAGSGVGDTEMLARGRRDCGQGGGPRSVDGVHDMHDETRAHETVEVRM